MADEANQPVTVEGIIANVDSSLSQTTDCSTSNNASVSAPSSAVSRHDFLAEYRDTNLEGNAMNINEHYIFISQIKS